MCGRYTLVKTEDQIEKRFKVKGGTKKVRPLYNAAPSQFLPVVSSQDPSSLSYYRWGLVPYWSQDDFSGKFSTINARTETVDEKATFKRAFLSQPCLVIADGYYEWKKEGGQKIPYRIVNSNQSLFAMAGIWDQWESHTGEALFSFSILTVPASKNLTTLHERMPVILPASAETSWLDNQLTVNKRKELCSIFDGSEMEFYTVSKKVGNVQYDSPELIQHVSHGIQGSLF
ncbi:SOS response-associated peptidase [Limibacter armeniacum]|uniref:SOS response-associated peptidase n=1 Tax=Limibacter armeniacum TaxID=466084 RepID=UPI002FE61808